MPADAVAAVDRLLAHPRAPLDERAFDEAARSVFAAAYEGNAAVRAYADRLARHPANVSHWTEIPALPTDAFKQAAVTGFAPQTAQRLFMTSGTAHGPASRGKIYKDEAALSLHDRAVCAGFERYSLPDGARLRIMVLAPPPARVPNLRMAYDCALFHERYGTAHSDHFVGAEGLEFARIETVLEQAEAARERLLLVGASFSFVVLFDYLRERGRSFSLPAGSRTVDGGGYKGRSRELTKPEFLDTAAAVLGVPPTHVVNLLGITELTSLYFDSVLLDATEGRVRDRFKSHSPWTRSLAVHPEMLQPLPRGEVGLLRHVDLANARICPALQTEDLGYETEGGFEVIGRARGAELRGCSLAMEQFLEAVG